MKPISIVMLLVFFFSGGSIGMFLGQKTASKAPASHCIPASHDEIDTFYTSILGVTEKQKEALAPIENEYFLQKQVFSKQMAVANNRLATIIEQQGYESSEVAHAVMDIHKAMGDLQNLTLQHLAEVNGVLTEGQAELLREHVVQRLRQNL